MLNFLYNLLLPIGFLFFVPGLLIKYRSRGGWKATYGERFGRFTPERRQELAAYHGAIWIHAVSVGETMVALSLIAKYRKRCPDRKFILSTTTTTGQELARNRAPANTAVIFCPIDFLWMVRRTFDVLQPSMLAIFETEIWPNLIGEARRRGIPAVLVNGRMSDHSAAGYRRARIFFDPLLRRFDALLVQTEADAERYRSISPAAKVIVNGNLKFDQSAPDSIDDPMLGIYFGPGEHSILLAASTHSGEEALVADSYLELKKRFPALKLILIPRHAERGADIAAMLAEKGLSFCRRSTGQNPPEPVDVLLADTTGEVFKFMNSADIVVMGKSLAGHDEGHNLIEPALLAKPIVTGHVLRNFRYLLDALRSADALVAVTGDAELTPRLAELLEKPELRRELGERARATIQHHRGAADRTIDELEKLLAEKH